MLTVHSLCWLCKMPLTLPSWGICSRCTASLFNPDIMCPQCGLPAAHHDRPCERCHYHPPLWQHLISVSDYLPPLSTLIHQFKFSGKAELAPILARLLLLAIKRESHLPLPDQLVSVPLWQRRHWKRGYNQSDLLCQALAHWLPCSYHPHTLTRTRHTAIQHQLSARKRKQNLKNAFQLELPVEGHHIVIVDDVVTTGSTMTELSRLLLQHGAASVQVWCLCRTL